MTNPKLTANSFGVLAMKSETGNFSKGFIPVGPFASSEEAAKWGRENIADTPFDNPHWVVVEMVEP